MWRAVGMFTRLTPLARAALAMLLSAPLLSQQFTDVAAELEVQNTSLDDSSPSGIGETAWVDVNADGYYDLWISRPIHLISPYRPVADRLLLITKQQMNRLQKKQQPTTWKYYMVLP